jgi:hypothetical protein
MKRKFLILVIFAMNVSRLNAQVEHLEYYFPSFPGFETAIIVDDKIIVGGTYQECAVPVVRAYDFSGKLLWFEGFASARGGVGHVMLDADSNLIVVYGSFREIDYPTNLDRIVAAKLDLDGNFIKELRFRGDTEVAGAAILKDSTISVMEKDTLFSMTPDLNPRYKKFIQKDIRKCEWIPEKEQMLVQSFNKPDLVVRSLTGDSLSTIPLETNAYYGTNQRDLFSIFQYNLRKWDFDSLIWRNLAILDFTTIKSVDIRENHIFIIGKRQDTKLVMKFDLQAETLSEELRTEDPFIDWDLFLDGDSINFCFGQNSEPNYDRNPDYALPFFSRLEKNEVDLNSNTDLQVLGYFYTNTVKLKVAATAGNTIYYDWLNTDEVQVGVTILNSGQDTVHGFFIISDRYWKVLCQDNRNELKVDTSLAPGETYTAYFDWYPYGQLVQVGNQLPSQFDICYFPFSRSDFDNNRQNDRICEVIPYDILVSTSNLDPENQCTISPNPVEDEFLLKQDFTHSYDLAIFNQTGQMVFFKKEIQDQEYRWQRNGLSSGLYILQMSFEEGNLSKKIILK